MLKTHTAGTEGNNFIMAAYLACMGHCHWPAPPTTGPYWWTGDDSVYKITWTHILAMWTLQNNHLHTNAAPLHLPNYRQAAMISLYEQCHLLPPAAQEALFHQPLESILEQPAPWLQTWTKRGLCYFNQQLKATKTQATLRTPDIHTYFRQQTQPSNDLHPPEATLLHCTSVVLLCSH